MRSLLLLLALACGALCARALAVETGSYTVWVEPRSENLALIIDRYGNWWFGGFRDGGATLDDPYPAIPSEPQGALLRANETPETRAKQPRTFTIIANPSGRFVVLDSEGNLYVLIASNGPSALKPFRNLRSK
jgi:hypothetical protein